LTAVAAAGSTCSSNTPSYQASYNTWGDMTSRSTGGVTGTLAYDGLDDLVRWTGSNSTEQWNWYDSSGQRVMQRTSVGGTVSYTVYAFGLEEHLYNVSGTNTGNTSSYSVGGHLIGEQTGTSTKTTTFLLTDLLGSVVASFSNTAGSAAVQGNRAYSPYGMPLYQQGSVGTSRGFTDQYADSTSGLDYDNARYYDPLVGQFVSADSVQGNLGGMDPYSYVGGNPETWTDPSGLMVDPILGGGGGEGGFGGDGLGGDIGGGDVGSGGGDTTPLTVTVPTADGLTSSLNPDDSVTLVTPEADGKSLEQTFEPGEPGYEQALQQVINQQVGNSPSELTLTEEEDTGPERAAIEAAVRNEAEGAANTTNTSGTGSGAGSAGGNNAATNDPYAGVTYTAPYQSGALQHIFEGEVNSNGRAVGYHWEGLPNTPGEVVPGTETST
jgi:RHS repeat-associated protein